MADAKDGLEFLEGGVGMFFDVRLELVGVELAPMAPALFRGQRAFFGRGQIPINGTPRQIKTPGGLDFGTPALNEFHHPFPQVQRIGFHAHQPITLCPNVNMICYIIKGPRLIVSQNIDDHWKSGVGYPAMFSIFSFNDHEA
jgi:hypothetical protein